MADEIVAIALEEGVKVAIDQLIEHFGNVGLCLINNNDNPLWYTVYFDA